MKPLKRIGAIFTFVAAILMAVAEAGADPAATLPPVFEKLPPDQQQVLRKEMQVAKRECELERNLSIYQDCGCLAVKVLEARMAAGPGISLNTLLDRVSRDCPNPAAIAPHQKKRCLEAMRYTASYKKEILENLCNCVGEAVAKNYVKKPMNTLDYLSKLYADAQMACGRAELDAARRK